MPIASAYQYYAFPLAIAQVLPTSRWWIASNFIQLEFDPRAEQAPVPFSFTIGDYATIPVLDTMNMSLDWFESGDVLSSFRKAIKNGWYVYCFFDEFFMPSRQAHGQHEYVHDSLVRGINLDASELLVTGYDSDDTLSSTWVSESNILRAFHSAIEKDIPYARVVMYRPRNTHEYGMDLELISRCLKEYLSSFNTSSHCSAHEISRAFLYGLDALEQVKQGLGTDFLDGEFYNRRNVQVLWEHKRLMSNSAELLTSSVQGIDSIVPEILRIESLASELKRIFLQNKYSEQSVDRSRAQRIIDDIVKSEKHTLVKLVKLIDRQIERKVTGID